ncbi:FlgD immunoglobulin-like domain containing protein [Streptomyces sp. NPDC014656]|uniref:FlgD immunoglobulin-like domain containing protein n=1 Tax=Streptomyces sp. NPDC014656 TaxID=3364878 RepID=UPI0036F6655A
MYRTASAPRSRARVVLLAAVLAAAGAGLAPVTAPVALAAPGAPVVGIDQLDIDPDWRAVPRGEVVTSVSASGYAHATEDGSDLTDDPLVWTDFASGTDTRLGYAAHEWFGEAGIGGRYAYLEPAPGTYAVRDLATGVQRAFTLPSDTTYAGLLGGTVLLRKGAGFQLVSAAAPAGTPTAVTGWPGDADLSTARLVAGDGSTAVIRFATAGEDPYTFTRLGLVDLGTGQVTAVRATTPTGSGGGLAPVALSADRLAWVDAARTVHVRLRTDPSGAERTFPLPDGLDGGGRIGLVGEWVLAAGQAQGADAALRRRIVALHPDKPEVTLLQRAQAEINQAGGDAAAVVGGTGATDWSLLKVVPGKDGTPLLEKLAAPVPPVPAAVESLALGAGRLSTLEDGGAAGRGFAERSLPVGPLHTGQSKPVRLGTGTQGVDPGTPLLDSGDGRTVHLAKDAGTWQVVARKASGQVTRVPTGEARGQIADAFGRWAVFQGDTRTLVVDLDAPAGGTQIPHRLTRTAAAVWGDTLFTTTAVTGEVARTDLATGKDLGKLTGVAPCPVTEYQAAAGRWLYWTCADGRQGVHDLRTRTKTDLGTRAPSGVLLGDGYVVDREPGGSRLRVTDVRAGQARTGLLDAAAPVTGERRVTWTVDRFGGAVAYRSADQRVHAVWTDVPASDLTAASASVPAGLRMPGSWQASWTLSKPASSYEARVLNGYSFKPVRTYRGAETRGRIALAWDGRDAAGVPVPNGRYVWEVRALTADGKGRDLYASGSFTVSGSRPAFRDLAGNDAQGDLLAVDTAGAVSLYRGNGLGGLSARTTASGAAFPSGTLLVPFGDVNADSCADVLGRVGNELRAYRPGCGKVVTASSPYTAIGAGWAQYDVLTSPGDVNGDGYADLIARQTTTGDMYFYAGTADHRLKSRLRIGVDWRLYKRITGAGDLDGDGRGDLLGVDAAGVLWSYYGTPSGGVTARVRVGGGWQAYTALQGVGDLDGDGDGDLVARDSSGRLHAYYSYAQGRTTAPFAPRELIGTGGWNTFRALF